MKTDYFFTVLSLRGVSRIVSEDPTHINNLINYFGFLLIIHCLFLEF